MSDGFYSGSPLGLNMLITEDEDLGKYFSELPDYVKEAINQKADSIHSAEELRDFADKLMQND